MSNIATRTPSKRKAATGSPLDVGAQMLAEAVASFVDPTSTMVKRNRTRLFATAYRSLAKAVPPEERLAVFRKMNKELSEIIAALQAELPVSDTDEEGGDSPMADLLNQERALRIQDVDAGRLVSPAALIARLGVTSQALSAAVKAKRIFAIDGPSGERLYPAFFADPKYERRDLEKVSKALGGLSGSIKWAFFTTPKTSLGNKRPLDVLPTKMERVLSLAHGLVEE